jgi:hypothetical protein
VIITVHKTIGDQADRRVEVDDPVVLDARFGVLEELGDPVGPPGALGEDFDDQRNVGGVEASEVLVGDRCRNHEHIGHPNRQRRGRHQHLDPMERGPLVRRLLIEQVAS